MIAAIRFALLLMLFFLLLGAVVAIAAPETGTAEKIVLGLMGAVLVWLAARVRRLGPRTA